MRLFKTPTDVPGKASTFSDEYLASRLRQGDAAALTLLVERHKLGLYRVIWRHVQNEDDTYDVLQETFIRLHYKIGQYDTNSRFKPWLYQIAVNLCRDHLRVRKLRQIFKPENETDSAIADESPSPEQTLAARERYLMVQQAIEKLPSSLREPFILFAVEGHSLIECANILNVSPKTIEPRVYRARKALNTLLKKKLASHTHFSDEI